MSERPELSRSLNSDTFRQYYYLKKELTEFCRENGLPTAGGKNEIEKRIIYFLDTGMVQPVQTTSVKVTKIDNICKSTVIEPNLHCTELHRAFFKEHIGSGFSFNVEFQKWLKNNSGLSYGDAIDAYFEIQRRKKTSKTVINKQFEYNTYIRDFFEDNKGKTLQDAIVCWKYKKSLSGHNRYEKSDLDAL